MEQVIRNNGISMIFASMEEYDAESPTLIAAHNTEIFNEFYHNRAQSSFSSFSWYGGGVTTTKQAMERVKAGDVELLEKIRRMWGDDKPDVQLAASTAKVRKRKRMRADYGDTLDMHRVWGGELDTAWERPERLYRLSTSQRHATLYIDLAAGCMVSADQALWRAATVILMCDILIAAGRSVEIYVGDSTIGGYANYSHPKYTWTAMCVKGYADPLIEERLATMVSLMYYRTYAFFMMMCAPFKMSSMGGAYNKGMPHQLEDRAAAGELVVRIGACFSKEAAIEEFNAVCKLLNKEEVGERQHVYGMTEWTA